MIADTNTIIRTYLITPSAETNALIALIGGAADPRIHCPRLPEKCAWPADEGAISFFTRGGSSDVYIKPIVSPSVQFNCWASDPIVTRQIYRALYHALQGIQNVTVGAYRILSAREEVQGQDLVDVDIPNYFSTLTFFEVMIAADT